jgi:hypothetical protein
VDVEEVELDRAWDLQLLVTVDIEEAELDGAWDDRNQDLSM